MFSCGWSTAFIISHLMTIAVGVPNKQDQLGKFISTPTSNNLVYARPPAQLLDNTYLGPNKENNQPSAVPVNAIAVGKPIPARSTNLRQGDNLQLNRNVQGPDIAIYPSTDSRAQGNLPAKGSHANHSPSSQSYNNIPLYSQYPTQSPAIDRTSLPVAPTASVYSRNPTSKQHFYSSPSRSSQSNVLGNQATVQGNNPRLFKSIQGYNNNFFNPLNAIYQKPAGSQYGQINQNVYSANPTSILSKGFNVPSTYTNQEGSRNPAQADTLFAVANPTQDKREVIGTYIPRNDFVNPDLFNIPEEDKHNIVNKIFGGFHKPDPANHHPLSSNPNNPPYSATRRNDRNNFGLFNANAVSQKPDNVLLGKHGKLSNTQAQSGNIQTNSFSPKNELSAPAIKPYSTPGLLDLSTNNKLSFNGGLHNPGAFPKTGILEPNEISAYPVQRAEPVNLNNKYFAPNTQNNLLRNSQKLNINETPGGSNILNTPLNVKSTVYNNNPTVPQVPNPSTNFDPFDAFKSSDLFPSANSRSMTSFHDDGNAYKDGSIFTAQPAPIPLFGDFTQAKPYTVGDFRSKNLLGEESFGQTDYDRNKQGSLSLFGDDNNYFGGAPQFGRQDGTQLNKGGLGIDLNNKGLGTGYGSGDGLQQIDGRVVTTGNSYDNVHSQNQGYNKLFDDSSNTIKNQPSSFTKHGGITNSYQQNDAFDNSGSFQDGSDYANEYKFKDGGSVNNQRSSNNQNENNFRKSFEDEHQTGDKESYSNADGYNNAFVDGRSYDLTNGYTDNVNYNDQNSNSAQQRYNGQDGYNKGVANVGSELAGNRGNLYGNLQSSVSRGLPSESSYKPFDVNKPVFRGGGS